MNDLIERQGAIDAICKHFNYDVNDDFVYWNREHVLRVLRDLPSAQPEQRWIPCSERRPEADGLYIVACGFHGEHSTFAYWNGDYWSIKTPVIAWMPGIEPYKMSEEEIHEDDMRMNYTLDLREVIKAGLIKNGGLND